MLRDGKTQQFDVKAERRGSWDWAGMLDTLPAIGGALAPLAELPGVGDGKNIEIVVNGKRHFPGSGTGPQVFHFDMDTDGRRHVERIVQRFGNGAPWASLNLSTLNPELGRYFGTDRGVLVLDSGEDTLKELRPGDVIQVIAGQPADSVSGVMRALSSEEPGKSVNVEVWRDRKRQVLVVTVPCVVVDDPGAADQLVTMLVENLHRDDLTVLEEAQTYQQLALLDWEPKRIAQATGRDLDRVQQSLTLHKLPEQVQQAAHTGQVDLISAAALTEFAHDPKVIERIMKKASGHWSVQHLIAEERHRQQTKDTLDRLKAELVLAGVKVTPRPKFLTEGGTAVPLHHLVDADGNPVDADAVKSEPGFAAYINRDVRHEALFLRMEVRDLHRFPCRSMGGKLAAA